MTTRLTLVDYGIGNLLSVRRAFEHCGAEVDAVNAADGIRRADRLVLPGVGAFEDGMQALRDRSLIEPIAEFAETDRPFLGICLGMQMMFEVSEEFGEHAGLGLLPGRVTPIPRTGVTGNEHKIPHIGWSALHLATSRRDWTGTILEGIDHEPFVYFVHSFAAVPDDDGHRLADCRYDGLVISAAVCRGNLYGTQFHPEKSGATGLRIVREFLSL